ncbi:acetyl-CoA C-acyltransferase [Nitrospirillum sp. BR 11163]|uniref:acetyl-CoA C-acyltransferase n=1 Tax=Nitrospirillum sp. BR 11163 TaxID=3104323 RepID=UPI002AFDF11D|nr:acetyl-CoA C-acyltransferase [Nitrospirillum sp. BR 11163]MEA1675838.1 acetyl-CoA C-acyltransferase [Nitrospirillum sp. BR 11163]
MSSDPIVIVSAARTAMGGMMGDLSSLPAAQLGAAAVKAAVDRAGLSPDAIDEVVMGCVLQAGQGQAPGRQAALAAGLPQSVPCSTLNKMCGSGMKAAMVAHDLLVAGSVDIALAGGMESMSNAPYLLDRARGGYRYGHATIYDHMALDGLEDAYDRGRAMGTFAEDTASHYQFTREMQDAYAIESLRRAKAAVENGWFDGETVGVTVKGKAGDVVINRDEQPLKGKPEKISTLKTPFRKDGTVTAASSASISDGAAALVLTRASVAEKRGLTPLARIVGHASHARAPNWFTTAPIGAIETLFAKTGWSARDVDLFEINEAFAVVPMAAMREFDIPHEKVNVHGGACALGHPIGASGARILVTLLAALQRYGQTRGVASLCIGGGEATAVAIERLN